eukprot:1234829-Prymnesium_polylepis.2
MASSGRLLKAEAIAETTKRSSSASESSSSRDRPSKSSVASARGAEQLTLLSTGPAVRKRGAGGAACICSLVRSHGSMLALLWGRVGGAAGARQAAPTCRGVAPSFFAAFTLAPDFMRRPREAVWSFSTAM